jgi:hypothetical protein
MISRRKQNENDICSIKFVVKIGQKVIENDIDNYLSIPTCDKITLPAVLQILSENPTLHARWNVLYNEATYEYDVIKTKYEIWHSKKSLEYRKELSKVSKGRVTDKMVDDMIILDVEYESINNQLSESKKNMKNILAIANGFGEKGDKIVSIASLLKWEGGKFDNNKSNYDNKKYSHIERSFEEKNDINFDINKNDGWPT